MRFLPQRNEVCNKISPPDTGDHGRVFDFDPRRRLFLPPAMWILWIDRRKGLSARSLCLLYVCLPVFGSGTLSFSRRRFKERKQWLWEIIIAPLAALLRLGLMRSLHFLMSVFIRRLCSSRSSTCVLFVSTKFKVKKRNKGRVETARTCCCAVNCFLRQSVSTNPITLEAERNLIPGTKRTKKPNCLWSAHKKKKTSGFHSTP